MASSDTSGVRRSSRLLRPSGPSPSESGSPSPARRSTTTSRSRTATPAKRKATTTSPGDDDDQEDNVHPPGLTALSTSATPSPSSGQSTPRPKRARPKSGYAPPSVYAHLPVLPDAVAPNLLVLFVGLNPGIETARQQHAYAHPSNLFWKLLFSSGVTPRLVPAREDRSLPAAYGLGLTNIVARPSRNGAELSRAEMDAGVAVLEEKTRRWRPEVVCVVGKSIWESIWRVRHGRGIGKAEFRYGWQEAGENMGVVGAEGPREEEKEDGVEYGEGAWAGARVFVSTSTSGLAATLKPAEKEVIWRELGEWVEKRREEEKGGSRR